MGINRERAQKSDKKKWWCSGCDRCLVGKYGKCPVCGYTEYPKKQKITQTAEEIIREQLND